jgi:hypothetical protein
MHRKHTMGVGLHFSLLPPVTDEQMPRHGAITFRDLIGKLDVPRVECEKCGRTGQYSVRRLIDHLAATPR